MLNGQWHSLLSFRCASLNVDLNGSQLKMLVEQSKTMKEGLKDIVVDNQMPLVFFFGCFL